jgi:hypothetical protein
VIYVRLQRGWEQKVCCIGGLQSGILGTGEFISDAVAGGKLVITRTCSYVARRSIISFANKTIGR